LLPYLAPGEQGALWDASLMGAVLGLQLGHEARHLARALVDGILLESRRCLSVLDDIGLPPGEVHVAGAAGSEPLFRSQLADATGRLVTASDDGESRHSALGAAALAASALDGVDLLSARRTAEVSDRPDPVRAGRFTALSIRHEQALSAVRAFSHAMREIGS
jgi:xylulokinase